MGSLTPTNQNTHIDDIGASDIRVISESFNGVIFYQIDRSISRNPERSKLHS